MNLLVVPNCVEGDAEGDIESDAENDVNGNAYGDSICDTSGNVERLSAVMPRWMSKVDGSGRRS